MNTSLTLFKLHSIVIFQYIKLDVTVRLFYNSNSNNTIDAFVFVALIAERITRFRDDRNSSQFI